MRAISPSCGRKKNDIEAVHLKKFFFLYFQRKQAATLCSLNNNDMSSTRFSLSPVWKNGRQGRVRGDSARQRSSGEQQARR